MLVMGESKQDSARVGLGRKVHAGSDIISLRRNRTNLKQIVAMMEYSLVTNSKRI